MRFNFNTSTRWAFICGISVGVLLAFPLAAPLFGGEILEGVATLWGNALGAIGAVAAAIWASDRAATSQQRQAASLITSLISPVADDLQDLTTFYELICAEDNNPDQPAYVPDQEDLNHLLKLVDSVSISHSRFKKNLHRMEVVVNAFDPSEMSMFLDLEDELLKMKNALDQVTHYVTTIRYPEYADGTGTGVKALSSTNNSISYHTYRFKKASL